jgi:hypothetical protein
MRIDPERWVFVYGLRDPGDKQMRYIGSSVDPYSRLRDHLYCATNRDMRNWIDLLSRDQLKPDFVILARTKAWFRDDLEAMLIDQYKRAGAQLFNINVPIAAGGKIGESVYVPGLSDESVTCTQCHNDFDLKSGNTCPTCGYHHSYKALRHIWQLGYNAEDDAKCPYKNARSAAYQQAWHAGNRWRKSKAS